MSLSIFRSFSRKQRKSSRAKRPFLRIRRPRFEMLEARNLLAVLPVFNTTDFSSAIDNAVAGDVISIQNDINLTGLTKTIATPNLTIQGQGTVQYVLSNPGKLTVTDTADNLTIQDIEFRNSNAVFEFSAASGSTLSGLTVDNTIFRGVVDAIRASENRGFNFTALLDDVTITNSQFLEVTSAFDSPQQVMLGVANLTNVTIDSNVFKDIAAVAENKVSIAVQVGANAEARSITPKNAWITNNYFENISGFARVDPGTEVHAIVAYGSDIHINNNTIIDISPGEDHEAIRLGVDNSEVLNNYIQNGGGKDGDGAIAIKGANDNPNNPYYLNFNNVIRGNIFIETAAYVAHPDYQNGGTGFLATGGVLFEDNIIIDRSSGLADNKAGIVVRGLIGPDDFGRGPTGPTTAIIRNNQIYTNAMRSVSLRGTVSTATSEISGNQVILRDSNLPFFSTKTAGVSIVNNSTCLEDTCPMPAYLVGGVVQNDTSVLVSWTDNSFAGANSVNETGFRLQYRVDGGQTWYDATWTNFGTSAAANATSLVVNGLAAGTNYRFRVQAFNGMNDSIWSPESAVVTTTGVGGGNTPPTGVNDSATTNQEVAVTIDVLDNDIDPDVGDMLSVSAVAQGASGTVTNNGTNVTYTPSTGFSGSDNFTYTVSDGNGGFDTATVNVTVNGPSSTFYRDAVLALNPVGYWRLGETSGTVANDETGNFDGTYAGGATLGQVGAITSDNNTAVGLDGSDDYVNIDGYQGVTGTGARTISAWIKADTAVDSLPIVAWGLDATGQKWTFRLDHPSGVLRVENEGGRILGTTVLADGQWHNVVVTWANDGTPDISDAKLYVDGSLETISTSNPNAVNTGVGSDVRIGRAVLDHYAASDIDEVAIFGFALTGTQISDLYSQATVNADFDNDGDTDGADFLAWQRGFGTAAPNAAPADGDADGDQDVDGEDLDAWQSLFGAGSTLPLAASTAPGLIKGVASSSFAATGLAEAMAAGWLAFAVDASRLASLDTQVGPTEDDMREAAFDDLVVIDPGTVDGVSIDRGTIDRAISETLGEGERRLPSHISAYDFVFTDMLDDVDDIWR